MSFKKPRADAVLRNLPEAVHADLVHMLVVENEGYKEVQAWLAKEHGVKTSMGALAAFWNTDCLSFKLTRAKSAADTVRDQLTSARPDFDKATIGLISQRAFELMASPGASADEVAKLIGAINDAHRVDLKREDLAISKAKLKLLQDKAALADKAKGELENPKLTQEEKMARFKAIFGVK